MDDHVNKNDSHLENKYKRYYQRGRCPLAYLLSKSADKLLRYF